MSIVRHLALGALLAVLASNSASAATVVLFDNISPSTNNYSISPTGSGPLAQSFINGPSASFLETLKLAVQLPTTSAPGSFVVTLNSDSSNAPGGLLATLGSFNDSQLSTVASVVTLSGLSLISGTGLAVNGRYWIELSGTSDSNSLWLYAQDASGTGTTGTKGLFSPNMTGFFTDQSSFPFEMTVVATDTQNVVATDTQDVPEPATIAVLGASLVGLGWVRSRRKASTQKG